MKLITDTDELKSFIAPLHEADFVTVDTEFMRERTYWPKLCLVQVGGPDEAAAIDPLAEGIDLTPLFDLLQDKKVLKVFHAARQDIEIFVNLTGKVPTPLFDTQVAAMVCGFGESVGYETLVTKLTKGRIDKTSRFTDWSKRPLTPKQLKYALSDVTYLRTIFEKLYQKAEKQNRLGWLEDDLSILRTISTYITHPKDAWKRIKLRHAKPRMIAVLQEVAAVREKEAQHRDIPRNRLFRDDTLMEISSHSPKTVEDLARTRGLQKNMAEGRIGRELLDAVGRGMAVPDEDLPKSPKKPEKPAGAAPLIEMLKVLLKVKCDQEDIASKLIANSADIEKIAIKDEPDVPAMKGWRYEVFGKDALRMKQGGIALTFSEGKTKIIELED